MKFQILLFFLGRMIKSKSKSDPEYKKKLAEKNCTVQIKTADNKKGRYYTFTNGEMTTAGGVAAKSDVAIVWQDAKIAFETLKSGSQQKTMQAVQSGQLKLEGDGGVALWFMDKAKQAR